jgi:hypothetical protein
MAADPRLRAVAEWRLLLQVGRSPRDKMLGAAYSIGKALQIAVPRPTASSRDEEVELARQRRLVHDGGQALCLPQHAGGPARHL